MSIDIKALQKRLSNKFQDSEIIGDNLVRFAKSYAGHQYAIYYIDLGGRLKEKVATLNSYQDRILGPQYFSGLKSLQWNNYLCLVASEDELKKPEDLSPTIFAASSRLKILGSCPFPF
jgi:hypothetical protein